MNDPAVLEGVDDATSDQTSRKRPQTSLAALLLMLVVFAIGFAWFKAHREVKKLEASVESMKWLARELLVDDKTQIAVVSRLPTRHNEVIFDVHIPVLTTGDEGYRLCLAVEEIRERHSFAKGVSIGQSLPNSERYTELSAGRHAIEIRYHKADAEDPASEHVIQVWIDASLAIEVRRPEDWIPGDGWSSSGVIHDSRNYNPQQPVELYRKRFFEKVKGGSTSVAGDDPAKGILVWIELAGKQNE